jgi:hypothetical protein
MATLATGIEIDRSKRYPDETKELAYQLWAFAAARNASEVARLLADGEYGIDDPPPIRTVTHWVTEHGWADRATRDVQSIAPDLRHQAFSELLFAGLDGARYIRRVNAGKEAPDKVRAMLAVAAVDRIGFSPVGKGMPAVEPPTTEQAITTESLDGKSSDELMRLELEYRATRKPR